MRRIVNNLPPSLPTGLSGSTLEGLQNWINYVKGEGRRAGKKRIEGMGEGRMIARNGKRIWEVKREETAINGKTVWEDGSQESVNGQSYIRRRQRV